ncbi:MAG: hypothetical protein MR598_02705 [Erysipelotrichaceae bacterium]|nr:hypothetical protein [Erysipelotrichaceae bacterium]
MGRELRRKEERKNKRKTTKNQKELDTSIKGSTIAKVAIFTVLLLLILYYILAVFITKEIDVSGTKGENTTEESNTNNVSNRILASATFEQKESEYYVYFYDFAEEDKNIASVISSKSDLKIYRVDTSSSLNQNYVTEDLGNHNVTGINDLKVKNPTLIQVTEDQVTAYYEGSSSIIAFLEQ